MLWLPLHYCQLLSWLLLLSKKKKNPRFFFWFLLTACCLLMRFSLYFYGCQSNGPAFFCTNVFIIHLLYMQYTLKHTLSYTRFLKDWQTQLTFLCRFHFTHPTNYVTLKLVFGCKLGSKFLVFFISLFLVGGKRFCYCILLL